MVASRIAGQGFPLADIWTIWLSIAVLIAAVVALYYGYRGRKLDNHPICAECKFDLFGLPHTSTVCPECGQSLQTRVAILIGNRERRSGLILLGIALLLHARELFHQHEPLLVGETG
jgi:hypothetical protein